MKRMNLLTLFYEGELKEVLAVWSTKPTPRDLKKVLKKDIGDVGPGDIKRILDGENVILDQSKFEYRLYEVEEGKLLYDLC